MSFRYDIQALRGFAVLVVVLFHAGIGPFAGGYLGVDIFFVISGFLITSILIKHNRQNDFSFKEFYYRRAKRLLPASYTVLFLTTAAAYFFLTASDFHDYKNQLLGALSFTANFALLDQTGYFEGSAETKPLLHMWSLAIEEQFYLVMPLMLYFLSARFWKAAIWAIVMLSLITCFYMVGHEPDVAFYMLPFRAWELGLGALGALYITQSRMQRMWKIAFFPALLLLIFLSMMPLFSVHPGVDAFLICMATLIVLMRNAPILNGRLVRPLCKIGDFSYSLYLVHWPLFSFAENAYMSSGVPLNVRIILTILSFTMAWGLYRFIENPIHHQPFAKPRRFILALVLVTVMLAAQMYAVYGTYKTGKNYEEIRRSNKGLSGDCDMDETYISLAHCRTGKNPKIMIWGDSYAMHLIPGIADVYKGGIVQATKSACAPMDNIANVYQTSEEKARKCLDFNKSVLKSLQQEKSVKTVILSGYLEKITDPDGFVLTFEKGDYKKVSRDQDRVVVAMEELIIKIRHMDKDVIIVSPPPKSEYNIGQCLEKNLSGKINLGGYKNCPVSDQFAREKYKDVYDFLTKVSKTARVRVVYIGDYLCSPRDCKTVTDKNIPIYRDDGHLTYEGSRYLFNKTGIKDALNLK